MQRNVQELVSTGTFHDGRAMKVTWMSVYGRTTTSNRCRLGLFWDSNLVILLSRKIFSCRKKIFVFITVLINQWREYMKDKRIWNGSKSIRLLLLSSPDNIWLNQVVIRENGSLKHLLVLILLSFFRQLSFILCQTWRTIDRRNKWGKMRRRMWAKCNQRKEGNHYLDGNRFLFLLHSLLRPFDFPPKSDRNSSSSLIRFFTRAVIIIIMFSSLIPNDIFLPFSLTLWFQWFFTREKRLHLSYVTFFFFLSCLHMSLEFDPVSVLLIVMRNVHLLWLNVSSRLWNRE